MEDKIFKINEFSDFVDNLDKLRLSCKNYNKGENPIELKWIVIHLYMTLQSSFILSLTPHNSFDVIKGIYKCTFDKKKYEFILSYLEDNAGYKKNGNEYSINYYSNIYETLKCIFTKEDIFKNIKDKDKTITDIYRNLTKLIPISELYQRICFKKKDDFKPYSSKKFANNSEHDKLILKIIEVRNNFIHVQPKTWYFTKEEIIKLLPESLKLISFLALESNTIIYYNDQDKYKVEEILLEINEIIKEGIKVVEGK